MNKFIILFLIPFFTINGQETETVPRYSIMELVELGLDKSLDIKAGQKEAESWQYRVKEASRPENPSVSLYGGSKDVKSSGSVLPSTGGLAYVEGGSSSGATFGVTVTQPLRLYGKRKDEKKQAELNRKLAGLDIEQRKLLVKFEIITLAYRLKVAEEQIVHAREEQERMKLLLEFISTKPKASPVIRLDYDTVKNHKTLLDRRLELMALETVNIWNELNLYLHMNDKPDLDIPWFTDGAEIDVAALIDGVENSITVRKNLAVLEKMSIAEKIARKKKYPDISVFAQYSRENAGSETEQIVNFGVNIPLPVFKSGHNEAEAVHSRMAAEKIRQEFAMQKVRMTVEKTYNRYEAVRKVMKKLPVSGIEQLHHNLDFAETEFRRGRITLEKFLGYIEQAHEMHSYIINTQMDYLVAYIDLLVIGSSGDFVIK